MHLVQELMGYDHRRARRDLGTPILATRHQDLSCPNFLTYLDERNLEDEERYLSDHGRSFIRKPFRKALKSFKIFQNIELTHQCRTPVNQELPAEIFAATSDCNS